jgi:2-phosphosulfolactate phosphatase
MVYPYRWRDAMAAAYAQCLGAMLAQRRRSASGYSLSPTSLLNMPAGTRLVLPSPNGAVLSTLAGPLLTLCQC